MSTLGSVARVVLYNTSCAELCGQTQVSCEIDVEFSFSQSGRHSRYPEKQIF